jgi:hypothetical protein
MLIALIPLIALIALNAASPLITLTCAWPSCKLQIIFGSAAALRGAFVERLEWPKRIRTILPLA